MAVSIQQRRRLKGVYFTVTIRVPPFPSASRTFPGRMEAVAWARDTERELKQLADRRAVRADVPKMTVAQLLKEFLEDPETKALKYYTDLSSLCAWWAAHCGPDRILNATADCILDKVHQGLGSGQPITAGLVPVQVPLRRAPCHK